LSRSAIAALRGDRSGSAETLAQILDEASDSQVGQILRSRLPRSPSAAQARKPWYIIASLSGGHNDNVIGLPTGALLPSDLSSKSSAFMRFQFDGGYSWRLNDISSVSAGYSYFNEQ
jgi:hypothetical protein